MLVCQFWQIASQLSASQTFADDTAIAGRIRDDEEDEYRCLAEDFVDQCQPKQKELVIDFRRYRATPRPVGVGRR